MVEEIGIFLVKDSQTLPPPPVIFARATSSVCLDVLDGRPLWQNGPKRHNLLIITPMYTYTFFIRGSSFPTSSPVPLRGPFKINAVATFFLRNKSISCYFL